MSGAINRQKVLRTYPIELWKFYQLDAASSFVNIICFVFVFMQNCFELLVLASAYTHP